MPTKNILHLANSTTYQADSINKHCNKLQTQSDEMSNPPYSKR